DEFLPQRPQANEGVKKTATDGDAGEATIHGKTPRLHPYPASLVFGTKVSFGSARSPSRFCMRRSRSPDPGIKETYRTSELSRAPKGGVIGGETYFVFGSVRVRRPSPTTLRAKIVMLSAKHGQKRRAGWEFILPWRARSIMFPQLGFGGCTPMPIK